MTIIPPGISRMELLFPISACSSWTALKIIWPKRDEKCLSHFATLSHPCGLAASLRMRGSWEEEHNIVKVFSACCLCFAQWGTSFCPKYRATEQKSARIFSELNHLLLRYLLHVQYSPAQYIQWCYDEKKVHVSSESFPQHTFSL